jgi:hypothetical protein
MRMSRLYGGTVRCSQNSARMSFDEDQVAVLRILADRRGDVLGRDRPPTFRGWPARRRVAIDAYDEPTSGVSTAPGQTSVTPIP